MRVQREGEQFDDQAGERVEESQQLGHGKAAPLLAPLGLAERLLQFRHVGGDRARGVDQAGPQPVPEAGPDSADTRARAGCQRLTHRRRTVPEQLLEHRQRQAHPRPAVRAGAQRVPGQVSQVGHRRVERQNLEHEQVDRRHRPELALPPLVPGTAAGVRD